MRTRSFLIAAALAAAAGLFTASCGSSTPTSPGGGSGGTNVTISLVSPATLSTTGGATVTLTGTNFGTAATVALDGTTISGATVTSTSITFTAPTHAAGAATFVVTAGGKTASGAVNFVAPSGANAAPVISNLKVTGPGSKPPSPFVDLSSNVTLSATVTDVETSPSALTYAWSVAAGTVTGSGASVTWQLPSFLSATPASVAASLTVTETYTEGGVQHRNVVIGSLAADAHDSSTEVLDKGFRFLDLFSQSSVPAATVVSDFDTNCGGYAEELQDTIDIRDNYLHLSYTITRMPPATFNYGGRCPNPKANPIGDACTVYRAHWVVRAIRDVEEEGGTVRQGETVTTDGVDYIGNVFRGGQWKLCSSYFVGDSATALVTSPNGRTRTIPTPKSLAPGRIK
jgi:hypothetical protein